MDTLHLYNTMTNRLEPFVPTDPKNVTFYTCGPTVYDDAHIGNFRAFLFADLLRRFIESPLCRVTDDAGRAHDGPRDVRHVINITDVGHMTDDADADGGGEDKMALAGERLAEAKKAGKLPEGTSIDPKDPRAIAAFFAERFVDDACKLGLKTTEQVRTKPKLAATLMPRASEHVEGMKSVIEQLAVHGFAYVAGEPGARAMYFDVQKFPAYGELSGNKLDELRGGAGGRVSDANQSEKRHPADFLLWKEDASHLMKWPGPVIDGLPLGEGYPGWHIECTAMSLGSLVPGGLRRVTGSSGGGGAHTIDLHSGGEDNIFPHHECENAQSCALMGADTFARHWVHARYLFFEGSKMSKSKGTFYTARQLFDMGHEPAAVRLELIKTHYRANADFGFEGLKASAKTVDRWRRFVEQGEVSADAGETDPSVRTAFTSAMHDDLNVAGAIGAVNAWMNTVESPTRADAALVRTFDAVLGVLDRPRLEAKETSIGVFKGVEPDPEVEQLLADRAAARKAKDFARADQIRDELAGRGLAIKDAAGGKVEVTRG
ncbi:MAG: hypothetical protein AAF297_05950 [Planctomycetota bacterium]